MKAITQDELEIIDNADQRTYSASLNLWSRLIAYADKQEYNRLGWLVAGILGHGTIFTILTLLTVTIFGNIFILYIVACCSMVMVVAVNLAALPTRYTITTLFISLLIDVCVIIAALILHYQV